MVDRIVDKGRVVKLMIARQEDRSAKERSLTLKFLMALFRILAK